MYAIDKVEVFQMQDSRSVPSGHGHLVSGCMRVDYGPMIFLWQLMLELVWLVHALWCRRSVSSARVGNKFERLRIFC